MKFLWPVRVEDGAFLGQKFGEHLVDYSPQLGHNGLDFPAKLGTKIYAACDGWVVEQTAKDTGFGLRISQRLEVDNRFYLLVYGHMLKLERDINIPYNWGRKDYPIKAGQLIGYVDSTGFSTGNHLHFGVYEQTQEGIRINPNNGYGGAIDPLPFLADEKEKPSMSNVIFAHKTGTPEYGFWVPATTVDSLKDKALNFGLGITKPDGSVDFDKAKEINGL